MKKVVALVLVVLFSAGVVSAYAADMPQSGTAKKGIFQQVADGLNTGAEKGKKAVVTGTDYVAGTPSEESVFQKSADYINNTSEAKVAAGKQSLRNNKAELMRRRGNLMKGKFLKV